MIRETADIGVIDETVLEQVEHPSRLRRAAVTCGKLAGLGAFSTLAGITSLFFVDTDSSLGPHDAKVQLNLEGTADFDLGPVGSIIIPIEDSGLLGGDITVGEVPTEASMDDYARSLANIENDLSDMKGDLTHQAAKNSLLAGAVFFGFYRFVGKRRWGEHAEHIQNRWAIAAATGLIAVNLSGAVFVGLSETSVAEEVGEPVDPVFKDTPLENARLTGYMPQIVNGFGREVIDLWRENDDFYDQVLANLQTEFEQQRSLIPRDGYPIALFYTDLHCNVGMARVIGETARLAGADFSLDAGDTTMGGTQIEEYCIQILSSELPDMPRIVVGGNHDGPNTEMQQRENGFRVLGGDVIEVEGLQILGDDDAMRSEFGQPVEQEGDESVESLSRRLADAACANEEVDILLVHRAEAAEDALRRNCVQTVLSGHVHHEELVRAPRYDGPATFELTGDNASGATHDQPSLGPVDEESPARIYLMRFDKETGRVLSYQTLTVFADASVELGDIEFVL